ACQGECACSTCHVILSSKEHYLSLDPPIEKESDMLDLAYGLTETSRLGCQLRMKRELSGVEITLPGITQDVQKDI
ncbi:ferredoxin, partial [Bimuria novae-zelandiae CBS 107.79]